MLLVQLLVFISNVFRDFSFLRGRLRLFWFFRNRHSLFLFLWSYIFLRLLFLLNILNFILLILFTFWVNFPNSQRINFFQLDRLGWLTYFSDLNGQCKLTLGCCLYLLTFAIVAFLLFFWLVLRFRWRYTLPLLLNHLWFTFFWSLIFWLGVVFARKLWVGFERLIRLKTAALGVGTVLHVTGFTRIRAGT